MSDDLVKRLRAVDISWSQVGEDCAAAADEIERLNAENARLRAALTKIIRQHERFVPDDELGDLHYQGGLEVCSDIARAALAEKEST